MRPAACAACALLACLALARGQDEGPASRPAPEPLPLRYRFDRLAGQRARYTVETELRQVVRHGDEPPAEGRRWRRDTVEQRLLRHGEGGRVEQQVVRVELAVDAPGEEPIVYDSQDGGEPPEGLERALASLSRRVTIELSAQGHVTDVRGAADPLQAGAYRASFLELPAAPLSIGDGWERTPPQEVPYPPFGSLTYRTDYRLVACEPPDERAPPGAEVGRGRWVIEARTQVLFAPAAQPAPDQPAADVRIVRQDAGGLLVFDGFGLLLESRFHSDLELRIEAEGVVRSEQARSSTLQRLRSLTPPGAAPR